MKTIILSCFIYFSCFDLSGQLFNRIPYNYKGLWGYSDTLGNMVITPQFGRAETYGENQTAEVFSQSKKYKGLIDAAGNFIFPCTFSSIDYQGHFYLTVDSAKQKIGLYTEKGKLVMPHIYDRIECIRKYFIAEKGAVQTVYEYRDGMNKARWIISAKNALVYVNYDWYADKMNYIQIIKGGKEYFYNDQGKSTKAEIAEDYPQVSMSIGGDEYMERQPMQGRSISRTEVYTGQNGKYGWFRYDGTTGKADSFPAEYDWLGNGWMGSDYSSSFPFFFAKKDGKSGIISHQGKVFVLFVYDSINTYSNGYTHASANPGEVGLNFYVLKNGKWGIINTMNPSVLVAPCIYSRIDYSELPWIALEKDGLLGYARIYGDKFLHKIEPKYKKIHQVYHGYSGQTILFVEGVNGDQFYVNLNGLEYYTQ